MHEVVYTSKHAEDAVYQNAACEAQEVGPSRTRQDDRIRQSEAGCTGRQRASAFPGAEIAMPNKPKTEFVIDRKKWHRGKGALGSRLLREDDGKMCCLGQVSKQCGIEDKEIIDVSSPHFLTFDAAKKIRAKIPWLLGSDSDGDTVNSRACISAMGTNDSLRYKEATRERRLKAIFKKHGATLTFIN